MMKAFKGFLCLLLLIFWSFEASLTNLTTNSEDSKADLFDSKVLAESIVFELSSQKVEITQGTTGSIGNYLSTTDSKSIDVFLTAKTGDNIPTWISLNEKLIDNIRFSSGSEISFDLNAVNLSVGSYTTTITATAADYTSTTLQVEVIVTSEPVVPLANLRINFQDEASTPPAGYLKDFGQAFGNRVSSGPDLFYGWKNIENGQPVNLTANGRKRNTPEDVLLATLMHVQGTSVAGFTGTKVDGVWEAKIPNGNYLVRISVGDGAEIDSRHTINVEGHNVINDFAPTTDHRFKSGSFALTLSDELL